MILAVMLSADPTFWHELVNPSLISHVSRAPRPPALCDSTTQNNCVRDPSTLLDTSIPYRSVGGCYLSSYRVLSVKHKLHENENDLVRLDGRKNWIFVVMGTYEAGEDESTLCLQKHSMLLEQLKMLKLWTIHCSFHCSWLYKERQGIVQNLDPAFSN